jgi:hypothetical protein
MVRALRDPDGANLDRVQIIKGAAVPTSSSALHHGEAVQGGVARVAPAVLLALAVRAGRAGSDRFPHLTSFITT